MSLTRGPGPGGAGSTTATGAAAPGAGVAVTVTGEGAGVGRVVSVQAAGLGWVTGWGVAPVLTSPAIMRGRNAPTVSATGLRRECRRRGAAAGGNAAGGGGGGGSIGGSAGGRDRSLRTRGTRAISRS